jgi:hypothetical protein
MADQPLPTLSRQIKFGQAEMSKILLAARESIESRITTLSKSRKLLRKRERERMYRGIGSIYEELDGEISRWADELAVRTGDAVGKETFNDIGQRAGLTKFSREHAQEWMSIVNPNNPALLGASQTARKPTLGASQTARMSVGDVSQLRSATLDVFRKSAISGMTQAAIYRELRDKFDNLAGGGLNSWQFISRDGKKWKNSNYFNMLTRTVSTTVAREASADAIVDTGNDLATIEGGGDPCPVCSNWRGVIVSVTGNDTRFPSKQQAIDSGVWHPNCVCMLRYVDPDAFPEEIEAQAKLANPDKPTNKEWNAYAERIQNKAEPRIAITEKGGALRVSNRKDAKLKDDNVGSGEVEPTS